MPTDSISRVKIVDVLGVVRSGQVNQLKSKSIQREQFEAKFNWMTGQLSHWGGAVIKQIDITGSGVGCWCAWLARVYHLTHLLSFC